jgi:hypothetical protein
MIHYEDQGLERMLADLESDLAERKESLKGDAPDKIREASRIWLPRSCGGSARQALPHRERHSRVLPC